MKKLLVLSTGWHFSSHFYETMPQQIIPNGWSVDYYCVAHRMPDDINTITDKDTIRNSQCNDFLCELDKILYKDILSVNDIENFGVSVLPTLVNLTPLISNLLFGNKSINSLL